MAIEGFSGLGLGSVGVRVWIMMIKVGSLGF